MNRFRFITLLFTSMVWFAQSSLLANDKPQFSNRLKDSTSPYLLQHAHNPVDWYPWGKEAFAKAKAENKPVFLSVGYAACHWCHVMERESFMDSAIAKILNDSFVCIKVDREERPDVDAVYMAALQAFMGGGGWPMNMMLTPEGRPFFGITYMPPKDKDGEEGFESILARVRDAWRDHRPELLRDAQNLSDSARRLASADAAQFRRGPIPANFTNMALRELSDQFDPNYGGFGSSSKQPKAPKFPEPTNLLFLLDLCEDKTFAKDLQQQDRARTMALTTIDSIARGGIRDHLAGGIHRYSTDRYWTVPHFEKMLYDNALWLNVCSRAFALTQALQWKHEVEDTVTFLDQSLLLPDGGFASSLDADTQGQEGLTYLWTKSELESLIKDHAEADLFREVYGLKLAPNFENRDYILAISQRWPSVEQDVKLSENEVYSKLQPLKKILLEARNKRPQPGLDDKCLTSWNGLAIGGLADAYRLTGDQRALELARNAAAFILDKHLDSNGLRHVSRGQTVSPDGPFLEDYAYLISGLVKLFQATNDQKWLVESQKLAKDMISKFSDQKNGGFFETLESADDLFVRPRNMFDNAMPSPSGMATLSLLEIGKQTGEKSFTERGQKSIEAASGFFSSSPDAVLSFVRAAMQNPQVSVAENKAADLPEAKKSKAKPMPVSVKPVITDKPIKVVSGKMVTVEFELLIDQGFHTYANPSGSDSAKPTELFLDEETSAPVELQIVEYPVGEFKQIESSGIEPVGVYEGRQRLKAQAKIPEDMKPQVKSVVFVLQYQVCTDQYCLPPAKVRIPISLEVIKP